MPVNDFVPFAAQTGANVVAQSNYIADPSTGAGFTAGIALSAKLNKVWRQSSVMSSAFGKFVMDQVNENVLDNGDVTALTDQIRRAINGAGDARYVLQSGDSMTGFLTLHAAPTAANHAATKAYVDSHATTGGTTYVRKAGDVMTGLLTLSGPPTANLHATTKAYVDSLIVAGGGGISMATADARYVNITGDTMTGFLILHSNPTAGGHAANKSYVDLHLTQAEADVRYFLKAGGTVTGDIAIAPTVLSDSPALTLNKPQATVANMLIGASVGKNRWIVALGNQSGESGSNAGSDFTVHRYTDAGAAIDVILTITRSTGIAHFNKQVTSAVAPTAADHLTRKDYVDAKIGTGSLTVTTADARYVNITGDTMTGFLNLHANPTANAHAANKAYVDARTVLNLPRAGGTMTGFIVLHAQPTAAMHAATKSYVDTHLTTAEATALYVRKTGDTMTGFLTLHANPTAASHAANKAYVDTHLTATEANLLYLRLTGGTITGNLYTTGYVQVASNIGGSGYIGLQGHVQTAAHLDAGTYCRVTKHLESDAGSGVIAAVLGQWNISGANTFCGWGCYVAGTLFIGASGQTGGYGVAINNDGVHLRNANLNADHSAWLRGGGVANWDVVSDARMKTEVQDYQAGLEQIKALSPISYRMLDGIDGKPRSEDRSIGLVADDVELIMPEMVFEQLRVGKKHRQEKIKMMNTSALTFAFINAIKELSAKVEALEARLGA